MNPTACAAQIQSAPSSSSIASNGGTRTRATPSCDASGVHGANSSDSTSLLGGRLRRLGLGQREVAVHDLPFPADRRVPFRDVPTRDERRTVRFLTVSDEVVR